MEACLLHLHLLLQTLRRGRLQEEKNQTVTKEKVNASSYFNGNYSKMDFPGGLDGKASAYNAGDPGSIPGSGRSPGEGNGNHSSTLAWKIPWTEKPGRLQSMGSQRLGHN